MELTRVARLAVYANPLKTEGMRYTYFKHLKYTQHFVTQLYFNKETKNISTIGMGQLANRGQHKAKGILKANKESSKATGNKSNCPQISQIGCPSKIEGSKNSSFDFWCSVENQFEGHKKIKFPVKGHKRLRHWLAKGYVLNGTCELHLDKNGKFYIIAFLQKEVAKAEPQQSFFGVDVGVNHSVSSSDGYLGRGLQKVLIKARDRNAERRRQNHFTKSLKTNLKQLLDVEAKRAVHVAKATQSNLVVEDPKLLANLKPRGRIAMWAKSYFANRAAIIAQEEEVFILAIRPAYTSMTCAKCGNRDRQSRVKLVFKCTACGNRTHADINAARVIAQKGYGIKDRFFKVSA